MFYGGKYEFTGETLNWDGHLLHRIKRLSDGKLGGWIESTHNLDTEGWVDDNAKVYGNAKIYGYAYVYGNAEVYGEAKVYSFAHVRGDAKVYGNVQVYGEGTYVCDSAQIYGNATVHGETECMIYQNVKIYGNAEVEESVVEGNAQIYDEAYVGYTYVRDSACVYGNARIYEHAVVKDSAHVYDNAKVYGYGRVGDNAKVYGNAKIYGYAKVFGDAQVYGSIKIADGEYTTGEFSCEEDLKCDKSKNCEAKKVVQDFIYKVDDSNKLTTQTEYGSVDEFFNEPIANDIKLDTLIICAVDTKEPLIKLQKVKAEDKTEFKFIVEITNEDGDDFVFRSIIKSQDQLNQLVQKTIDALRLYPKFNKYADDLENYL